MGLKAVLGILLDSTGLIIAERTNDTPRKVIAGLIASQGDVVAVLSVITVIELAHGIERANTVERRMRRERFLDELLAEVAVEPVTVPIAFRAGRIDGGLQAKGMRIALGDLLIGATALELGHAVATHNVRHFEVIPNLVVKKLWPIPADTLLTPKPRAPSRRASKLKKRFTGEMHIVARQFLDSCKAQVEIHACFIGIEHLPYDAAQTLRNGPLRQVLQ